MGRKVIGKVAEDEKEEIRLIYERKNGLTELFKIVSNEQPINEAMYSKIVKDMGEAISKFNDWWASKQKKYNWEDIAGCRWEINFETCEIYLVGDKIK